MANRVVPHPGQLPPVQYNPYGQQGGLYGQEGTGGNVTIAVTKEEDEDEEDIQEELEHVKNEVEDRKNKGKKKKRKKKKKKKKSSKKGSKDFVVVSKDIFARGRRHRDITCPRKKVQSKNNIEYQEYALSDLSDAELAKYGLGVMLYFQSIRTLCYMWIIMGIINLPSMLINIGAAHSMSYDARCSATLTGIEWTTSGGLWPTCIQLGEVVNFRDASEGMVNIMGREMDISNIQLIQCSTDVLSVLVFLVTFWYMSGHQRKQTSAYNASVVNVSSYSIEVRGLPKDFQDRTELADFFENKYDCEVADVAFAVDNFDLLEAYRVRGLLRRSMAGAAMMKDLNKHKELFEKLKDIDKAIEDLNEAYPERRTVGAFVTFQSQYDRMRSTAEERTGFFRRRKKLYFQGHRLRVQRAVEPSNFFFRNLKYGSCNKFCRRLGANAVTGLVITVSVLIVFLAQIYRSGADTSEMVSYCKELYANSTDGLTQAMAEQDAVDGNLRLCFCQAQEKTDLATLYADTCTHYIFSSALETLLIVMSVLTITLVNWMLKKVVTKLGDFEKHKTVTNLQTAVTRKLFISQTINTAFVLLLINSRFSTRVMSWLETKTEQLTGSLFDLIRDDGEKFDDFTYGWYNVVGYSIILTQLTMIVTPQLWVFLLLIWQKLRVSCCVPTKATMDDVIRRFNGAEMTMSSRFASLLTVMAVTMIYSAGMPILYFTAATGYFVTYWVEKFGFARLYKTPARYDNSLNDMLIEWMPTMAILHTAFSFWFYTAPIYTRGDDFKDGQFFSRVVQGSRRVFGERIESVYVLPTIIIFFIIVFVEFIRYFCGCCTSKFDPDLELQHNPQWKPKLFEEVSKKIRFESYHAYKAPHWEPAFLRTTSKKQLKVPSSLKRLREKAAAKTQSLYDEEDEPEETQANPTAVGGAKLAKPEDAVTNKQKSVNMVVLNCPSCRQLLQVQDTGQPALYICSYCSAQFMM